MILSRRGLIKGIGASLLAAPAVVRAASLMTVKPWFNDPWFIAPDLADGVLLTPGLITAKFLKILQNNLVAAQMVNGTFEGRFARIGQPLKIRAPSKFSVMA